MGSLYDYSRFPASVVEYQALETVITIYPTQSSPRPMLFVERDLAAFQTGNPIQVPLWHALQLSQSNRCRISRPTWLNVESLETTLASERVPDSGLTPLPYFYLEVAELLYRHARDDLGIGTDVDRIMDLLAEIQTIRMNKTRAGAASVLKKTKGVGNVDRELFPVQLTNFCASEINAFRGGFLKAMDLISQLSEAQGSAQAAFGASGAGSSGLSAGAGSSAAAGGSGSGAAGAMDLYDDIDGDGGRQDRSNVRKRMKARLARSRGAADDDGTGTGSGAGEPDQAGGSSGGAAGSGDGAEPGGPGSGDLDDF